MALMLLLLLLLLLLMMMMMTMMAMSAVSSRHEDFCINVLGSIVIRPVFQNSAFIMHLSWPPMRMRWRPLYFAGRSFFRSPSPRLSHGCEPGTKIVIQNFGGPSPVTWGHVVFTRLLYRTQCERGCNGRGRPGSVERKSPSGVTGSVSVPQKL